MNHNLEQRFESLKKVNKTAVALAALLFTATVSMAGEENNSTEPTVASDSFTNAFRNGKVSGQIRAGYLYADPDLEGHPSPYATALGGQLKFETGKWYGFDLGAAFYTSHAINALSGERNDGKFNDELSSDAGHYDLLAEAYLDYSYEGFKIRVGRQLIDTPYADSDDIRMTPNTFEGVVATWAYEDFSFIGAYLTKWQGPDAGVYDFIDLLEDGDGVAMLAVTYEKDDLEGGLWYYNADKTANVFYGTISDSYKFTSGVTLTGALQIGDQSEIDHSGIDGTIYGAMAEIDYKGLTLSFAYDQLKVDEDKEYFGGFGGGVGFVNMFEMTAGVFTLHQDAKGWKAAIAYDFTELGLDGLSIEYDYGNFKGDVEHEANEHNLMLAYTPSDDWDLEIVYDRIEDVNMDIGEDEDGNPIDYSLDRVLVRVNYNF
jgi:hypothetical protein